MGLIEIVGRVFQPEQERNISNPEAAAVLDTFFNKPGEIVLDSERNPVQYMGDYESYVEDLRLYDRYIKLGLHYDLLQIGFPRAKLPLGMTRFDRQAFTGCVKQYDFIYRPRIHVMNAERNASTIEVQNLGIQTYNYNDYINIYKKQTKLLFPKSYHEA